MLLIVLLVSVPSLNTLAQGTNVSHAGQLKFGKLMPKNVNGEMTVTATLKEIVADPKLNFEGPSYTVVSFMFAMHPKDREYIGPISVKGASFTKAIINKLLELKNPEGKIFIENIKVKDADNTTRTYSSLYLNVIKNNKQD
jgi:hypothetical protein